jgi:hypothetical protein
MAYRFKTARNYQERLDVMNDRIKEVALRVAREMELECEHPAIDRIYIKFLTRCLQELSKDVEPVAWMFPDDEERGYIAYQGKPPTKEQVDYLAKWNRPTWVPLYLHPPLTEQDKPDAARYRWLRERMDTKDRSTFVQRKVYGVEEWNENIDAAIDKAMENGK